MKSEQKINSPGYYLSKLMRIHRQQLGKKVAHMGISIGQVSTIMEILDCPGCSQDEISNSLAIDKAATARSLAALEKSGFITRLENEKNRRQKLVYPTEKALKIESSLRGILAESKQYFFKNFTENEQEQALLLLERMVESYAQSVSGNE
ncbi:MarR family winged helix-turn-helix transcriptional regulator [Maridesulfovibrio bastinii]|uniref:MarR family winged helix-turn-helix transcriptional regulator n=1 Tax=Maridesulfovibrio bastinii TaxID=47157 RepID=UPI0004298FF9|nr:MarR family transcriptional regulator [Maridesulfovibrio bastinii]